jgi:hypothetical protein
MCARHALVDLEDPSVNYLFVSVFWQIILPCVVTEEVIAVHQTIVRHAVVDMVECNVNYRFVLVYYQVIIRYVAIEEEIVVRQITVLLV